MAASSPPHSIPDTQLGLSAGELQLLRYHQHVALGAGGSQHARTQSSHSYAGSSSHTASAASSGAGRLLLDAGSLSALAAHFDRLMASIQQRWMALYQETQTATQSQYDRAGNLIQQADAQIARFHEVLRQIDELQTEFAKVQRIGEIVKGFRARVEALDRHF
ncbi:hypothetical protein EJ06DRAFT_568493 [Trichodelitschia bisporula]|uniref:Biogenesis of lysosome-related organelles complex 1 subunit CNL1 n=1 Tax=Trichodelitschia bisporula TaxID=703511 RepID=A0A6G1I8Y9_9PEZI|nr:hypothetical protein EJ06DRAFT_568493 [Trichodelitschia bisporula]